MTYGARVWEKPEPRKSGENLVRKVISVDNFLDCAAGVKRLFLSLQPLDCPEIVIADIQLSDIESERWRSDSENPNRPK